MTTGLVVPCPTVKGRKHDATWLSGWCSAGTDHDRCPGLYTHPCGCTATCRCTAPGHPDDHPHPCQEAPVLPSPFRVPGTDHPEAVVQPPSNPAPEAVVSPGQPGEHGWDVPAPKDRPWIDGTGAGAAPLAVMVRAFAMAAGDLHLHDDRLEDYGPEGALALLTVLRAAVKRAGIMDALLVKYIYDHGQRGESLVDGIGRVHVHRRDAKVRWDERGTAHAIIDHHMEDLGGETPDPYVVLDWLLEAASVGYYRVTALRPLGIDPEEYRHKEKGSIAVDVPVPD